MNQSLKQPLHQEAKFLYNRQNIGRLKVFNDHLSKMASFPNRHYTMKHLEPD